MTELGRRLVHSSGSLVPLLYIAGVMTWIQVQAAVLLAMGITAVLEGLRLSGHLDWWVYQQFTREYEANWPAGYALALVGASVTVLVFEPFVAVPGLLMLTIGDPVSGVLSSGNLEGKQSYVMLAMFGVCLAIAGLLRIPAVPAILGAGGATAADGLKPRIAGYIIDDNLTIPVVASGAMQVGLLLVG